VSASYAVPLRGPIPSRTVPPVPPDAPLRLLTVHAHPDDEASKGAATVACLHAQGVYCVLVCCTGGEAGDILNPEMDRPEVRADLASVREAELARAAAIIGYDEVAMLGYRDSGMKESEHNAHPDAFAAADPAEAVGDPPLADSADDGLRPFETPPVEMTDERADLLHRFGVLGAVALVALILILWRRRRRAG